MSVDIFIFADDRLGANVFRFAEIIAQVPQLRFFNHFRPASPVSLCSHKVEQVRGRVRGNTDRCKVFINRAQCVSPSKKKPTSWAGSSYVARISLQRESEMNLVGFLYRVAFHFSKYD